MNGPLPAVLAPLTWPASLIYGAAVRRRNRSLDASPAVRVDRPVISVGNLTAGGAGKTPLVRWIATRLLREGHHPVIAMRGYGSRGGAPGDEEREYRDRLPDVPVVADPDRAGALGTYLPAHREIDVVLLDDGFQHRRLHRDLDIVVVDATRPCLDGALLPHGWLREPPDALRRAGAVVITRADGLRAELSEAVRAHHGRPPIAWSRHAWSALEVHDAHGVTTRDVDWLRGRTVTTLFGTGHPDSIARQVTAAGAVIATRVPARDHEHYTERTLARLREHGQAADGLLTTAKDWVKLRDLIDLTTWPTPIIVPILDLDMHTGANELLALIHTTMQKSRTP